VPTALAATAKTEPQPFLFERAPWFSWVIGDVQLPAAKLTGLGLGGEKYFEIKGTQGLGKSVVSI
jgi:hypothetical protein